MIFKNLVLQALRTIRFRFLQKKSTKNFHACVPLSSGRQRKTGFTSNREGKTGLSSCKQGGFSPYRMARNDIELGSSRQGKTGL